MRQANRVIFGPSHEDLDSRSSVTKQYLLQMQVLFHLMIPVGGLQLSESLPPHRDSVMFCLAHNQPAEGIRTSSPL